MTTKLTLSVEKGIIETAKRYAKKQRMSLSEIIENYLRAITQGTKKDQNIDPDILALSDTIDPEEFQSFEDPRFYYLKEKHIH